MIPRAHIQQWAAFAPWPDLRQVEQDLVISRALCDLFASKAIRDRIAFRGGTAIHKLLLTKPLRYSEDIDLVQTRAEPIGPVIDSVQEALSWLGRGKRTQTQRSTTLVFRFTPEEAGDQPLKLKIEINTREHQSRHGFRRYQFGVDSDWHRAQVEITSYDPEELLATKLRALLQRNKNRDLFDLNEALLLPGLDGDRLLECFRHYLEQDGHPITRAIAEERMLNKLNTSLTEDIAPLLPPGVNFDEAAAIAAFSLVWQTLITRLPGEPWKSTPAVIATIRATKIPALLDGIVDRGDGDIPAEEPHGEPPSSDRRRK
jgi:predicted nucleotidyltransferase component of viral defense system